LKNKIEHEGIVKKIDNSILIISILNKAACISCQVKGVCSVSDIEEKEIEVKRIDATEFKTGEKVVVHYAEELGFFALFLGYILPFLILMGVIIIGNTLNYSDGISGLLALLCMVPYYAGLYIFKDKIKKTFQFSVEKMDNFGFKQDFKIIND
jgi:sigma-E factor negative regulatory protein RseC